MACTSLAKSDTRTGGEGGMSAASGVDHVDRLKAADPSHGYDARYGSSSGDWTTADFIAAGYQNLKQKPAYETLQRDTGITII